MGWLYLLGALVFPPAFILWRPREPLGPRARRVRLAGAIVVVWMLTILWGLGGSIGADANDELRGEVHDFTPGRQPALQRQAQRDQAGEPSPATRPATAGDAKDDDDAQAATPADSSSPDPNTDVSFDWHAEGAGYSNLALALGWAPGLFYAGLLMLARKAVEEPPVEVVEVDLPSRRQW